MAASKTDDCISSYYCDILITSLCQSIKLDVLVLILVIATLVHCSVSCTVRNLSDSVNVDESKLGFCECRRMN